MPIDDTWDISGWDLDKTMKLLYKSNPTVYEWLASPICYRRTDFAERIRPLMNHYFSAKRMLYHYLNTAKHNVTDSLKGETVQPKKYFYALRPILACYWVLDCRTAPPVLFSDLAGAKMPAELRPSLDRLLDLKMNGPEKMEIRPIPDIDAFLDRSIRKFDEYLARLPKDEPKSWERMNHFFIEETSRPAKR